MKKEKDPGVNIVKKWHNTISALVLKYIKYE